MTGIAIGFREPNSSCQRRVQCIFVDTTEIENEHCTPIEKGNIRGVPVSKAKLVLKISIYGSTTTRVLQQTFTKLMRLFLSIFPATCYINSTGILSIISDESPSLSHLVMSWSFKFYGVGGWDWKFILFWLNPMSSTTDSGGAEPCENLILA
ncbi:hypothetical protein I7I51_05238 [Histoplasma capsulatum]|uniref:Uncharacterized protein n=1 Tax=Ajellomyces capsulatus TaxID=5037 RepID=A0A8A1M2Z1_AJECA|nr:hypothetical protein I7I51_05238 [Histoplasma capsulatum]